MNTEIVEAERNEGEGGVVSFEGMPSFENARYHSENFKSLVNRLKAEGYYREEPEVEDWIRSINEMDDADLPTIHMCTFEG